MFSDNSNNIMLAAILSLLLVILFVLLLHIYAKWFLSRPRRGRVPSPGVINIEVPTTSLPTKGLNSKIVSSIPTFKAKQRETMQELECVICLSDIEEGEVGRKLPKCGHVFHVECIDMWLSSHCNCPICRESIVENENDCDDDDNVVGVVIGESGSGVVSVSESETSLSLLGYSLKRMLSKVFLSSSSYVNGLEGSQ